MNGTIKAFLMTMLSLFIVINSFAIEADKGNYLTLKTHDNKSFEVYVSDSKKAQHAVLVIHGWWGLNKDVRHWADELSQLGYQVMAIDLYNGKTAMEPQYAKQLMQSVKQIEANEKYKAALNELSRKNRKIAVVGASYGGSQALHASLVAPEKIAATIMYYPFGKLVNNQDELARLKNPVLGHFANQDFAFTPEKFKLFHQLIKQANVSFKPYIYEANHGFAKPGGKNFNFKAYQLSQNRTRQFLLSHLK